MAKELFAARKPVANATEASNDTITLDVVRQIVTLEIKHHPDGTLSAEAQPSYIRVPAVSKESNGLALITWNVLNTGLKPNEDLRLDTPGITFFGEDPNMVKLEVTGKYCEALWCNDRPSQSYSYRVHLVLITNNQDGTRTYTPITNDPIVHNDPPTAE